MATDVYYLLRKKSFIIENKPYSGIFQINGIMGPAGSAEEEVLSLVEASKLHEAFEKQNELFAEIRDLKTQLHQAEEDSKAERESPTPKWVTDAPSGAGKDWSGTIIGGLLLACLVCCGVYTRCAHVEALEVKEHTTARQQICASLLTVIHQEVAQRKASCQQQVQRKAYLYAAAKNKLNKDEAALLPEPPDLFICDQMVNDSAVEDECFNFVNLYPGIETLMHH